jgi:hypothetical protein
MTDGDIAVELSNMRIAIERLCRLVEGNGKPGLIDRMNSIEHGFDFMNRANLVARVDMLEIVVTKHHDKADVASTKTTADAANKRDIIVKILMVFVGVIISNVGIIVMELIK